MKIIFNKSFLSSSMALVANTGWSLYNYYYFYQHMKDMFFMQNHGLYAEINSGKCKKNTSYAAPGCVDYYCRDSSSYTMAGLENDSKEMVTRYRTIGYIYAISSLCVCFIKMCELLLHRKSGKRHNEGSNQFENFEQPSQTLDAGRHGEHLSNFPSRVTLLYALINTSFYLISPSFLDACTLYLPTKLFANSNILNLADISSRMPFPHDNTQNFYIAYIALITSNTLLFPISIGLLFLYFKPINNAVKKRPPRQKKNRYMKINKRGRVPTMSTEDKKRYSLLQHKHTIHEDEDEHEHEKFVL